MTDEISLYLQTHIAITQGAVGPETIPLMKRFLETRPDPALVSSLADCCALRGMPEVAEELRRWAARETARRASVQRGGAQAAQAVGAGPAFFVVQGGADPADEPAADAPAAEPAPDAEPSADATPAPVFNLRPEDLSLFGRMPVDQIRQQVAADGARDRVRAHDLHSEQLRRTNELEEGTHRVSRARVLEAEAKSVHAMNAAANFGREQERIDRRDEREERKLNLAERKEERIATTTNWGAIFIAIAAGCGAALAGVKLYNELTKSSERTSRTSRRYVERDESEPWRLHSGRSSRARRLTSGRSSRRLPSGSSRDFEGIGRDFEGAGRELEGVDYIEGEIIDDLV